MTVRGTTRERATGDAEDHTVNLCDLVQGQLSVLAGRPDVVAAACAEIEAEAARRAEPDVAVLSRLAAAVAGARSEGPAAGDRSDSLAQGARLRRAPTNAYSCPRAKWR